MRETHDLMRWFVGFILVSALGSTARPQAGDTGAQVKMRAGAPNFPSFDRALLLETSSETSANLSIGDVNGDGNLDVVLVKGRHWPLVDRVLLGDGRGHFVTGYDLGAAADRSYSGQLVDVDGDGDLDVVISNDAPDPKVVYLNDGHGRFHVGSTYGRPEWKTRNASVADLNGDGQPDIIVANRGSGANYICLNKGKVRFDADGIPFSHEPATTIAPGDFNHDGLIDLAVPNRDGGQSHVYLNGGSASFSDMRRISFGPPDATIRVAEAADLEGNGSLDIAAIDEKSGVAVYFGQSDGMFSPSTAIDDGRVTPYALALGDLNGDKTIDVVVGHVGAPSTIYFNDGSGRHYSAVTFGDAKGTVYGVAIADLDKDGFPDIALARSDAPNVVCFARPESPGTRNGAVTSTPASTLATQEEKQTPQLTETSSELERRDQPVTEDDLRILLKTDEILKDESVWNRNDDRVCVDDESIGKWSLFCALQKACIDVLGKYDHRRVALQEVRFAVEDATRGRHFEHRLRDFNNLPETRFADVKKVLKIASDRVKSRLKENTR